MRINRNWIICGLGALLVVLAFGGLPFEMERIAIILIGIAVAIMAFWKETRQVIERAEENLNSTSSITQ